MHRPLVRFLFRWVACGLGLWISAALLSNHLTYNHDASVIIIAGLVLATINIIIKPIVVILALPAILLSLGLFMIIVNGLMVLLASKLYTPLHVTNVWVAMVAGMVIGLVNYLVTTIVEGI